MNQLTDTRLPPLKNHKEVPNVTRTEDHISHPRHCRTYLRNWVLCEAGDMGDDDELETLRLEHDPKLRGRLVSTIYQLVVRVPCKALGRSANPCPDGNRLDCAEHGRGAVGPPLPRRTNLWLGRHSHLGGLRGSMDLFLLQTADSSLKMRILGERPSMSLKSQRASKNRGGWASSALPSVARPSGRPTQAKRLTPKCFALLLALNVILAFHP
jgi:hypothetical protein